MSLNIGIGDPDTKNAQTRSERGACSDCPQWTNCLFHMPRYGAFKGQGKRYVRYRLITDAAENSNAKEDFCSCESFIDGGLQDRMLTSQSLRAEGKAGELVSILNDERDSVTQNAQMGFNSRSEIIKPMPSLVDDLRAAGYKVNIEDNSQAVEFREVEFERKVPKFREIPRGRSNYSQKIAGREAEREGVEIDIEAQAWAASRSRKAATAPAIEFVTDEDDEVRGK